MKISHAEYESTHDCETIKSALWSLARAIAGSDLEYRDPNLNVWADHYANYRQTGAGITVDEIDWYIRWCDVSEAYHALDEAAQGTEDYPLDDYEAEVDYMEEMVRRASSAS